MFEKRPFHLAQTVLQFTVLLPQPCPPCSATHPSSLSKLLRRAPIPLQEYKRISGRITHDILAGSEALILQPLRLKAAVNGSTPEDTHIPRLEVKMPRFQTHKPLLTDSYGVNYSYVKNANGDIQPPFLQVSTKEHTAAGWLCSDSLEKWNPEQTSLRSESCEARVQYLLNWRRFLEPLKDGLPDARS